MSTVHQPTYALAANMRPANTRVNAPDTRAEAIDAVYLWVDIPAAELRFARQQTFAGNQPANPLAGQSISPAMFRDIGELRYSLRSLYLHAPWIRNIYLVTNGQVPHWLNREHPRLRLVSHQDIFRQPDALPTFNSNAIELQLHRIPGLSRRFLYLNDDVMFGAPTAAPDFLTEDSRQRFFIQPTPLHDNPNEGSVHDRAYAWTQRLAASYWGSLPHPQLPAHVPQLYDTEIIREIEATLPEAYIRTATNRFRSPDDLVLRIIYMNRILAHVTGRLDSAEKIVLEENSRDYVFARIGKSVLLNVRQLIRITRMRPRFFCINDEIETRIAAAALRYTLPLFLNRLFPEPSPFEIST